MDERVHLSARLYVSCPACDKAWPRRNACDHLAIRRQQGLSKKLDETRVLVDSNSMHNYVIPKFSPICRSKNTRFVFDAACEWRNRLDLFCKTRAQRTRTGNSHLATKHIYKFRRGAISRPPEQSSQIGEPQFRARLTGA